MNDENFQHGGTNIHYLGKNSVFRKNKTAKASKGRIFGLFYYWGSTTPIRYNPRFLHHQGQKMDTRFVQAHKEARWGWG